MHFPFTYQKSQKAFPFFSNIQKIKNKNHKLKKPKIFSFLLKKIKNPKRTYLSISSLSKDPKRFSL